MSIIQDLYTIYDKEQAKYRARRSSQNQVLSELQGNLAFLREGLRESLTPNAIVNGLEDDAFRAATKQALNLDSLRKQKLERATYAGIREFERYRDWPTGRLISNTYERIATPKKLAAGSTSIDLTARLRSLFKFLMVVVAHLQGRRLTQNGD